MYWCLMSICINMYRHLMSIFCQMSDDVECLRWHCVPWLLCTNAANFTAETHWSQTDIIFFAKGFRIQNCLSVLRDDRNFKCSPDSSNLLQISPRSMPQAGFKKLWQKFWYKFNLLCIEEVLSAIDGLLTFDCLQTKWDLKETVLTKMTSILHSNVLASYQHFIR